MSGPYQNAIEISKAAPITKEIPKTAPMTIDSHVKSVAKIKVNALPPLEKKVVNALGRNWNLSSVEVADYASSNMKGYLIKNAGDSNLSQMIYFNDGNYFKLLFKKERISDNLEKIILTSPDGIEYLNFMLMDGVYLSHLNVYNEVPFRTIMNKKERLAFVAKPDSSDTGGCTSLGFGDCIECAFSECASDWQCAIMCGLAPELCMPTWTIGCTFG